MFGLALRKGKSLQLGAVCTPEGAQPPRSAGRGTQYWTLTQRGPAFAVAGTWCHRGLQTLRSTVDFSSLLPQVAYCLNKLPQARWLTIEMLFQFWRSAFTKVHASLVPLEGPGKVL